MSMQITLIRTLRQFKHINCFVPGTLVLVGCTFYKLFATYQIYQDAFPGDIVGPTVLILSYFLNGISVILERRLNIHSSVILFYFWFLHFMMSIPILVKEIMIFIGKIDSDTTRYTGCGGQGSERFHMLISQAAQNSKL